MIYNISISPENITCVNVILYIVQTTIIAIGNNCLALLLEGFQIIHHFAAEECAAILQCGLINDYFRALCLYTFHYALDGRLAEIIAV